MKYSVQAIHFQESADEESRVFENISNAFKNSPYIQRPKSSQTRRNFNNLIPLCQFSGVPQEATFSNCDLFHRTFSNRGFSYSFNSDQFWRMFQKSEYNKLFERIMAPNLKNKIIYPDSSGPEYGLRFLLNGYFENRYRNII